MATKMVKEQALIVGPYAWETAGKAEGIHIAADHESITINNGNEGKVIDHLVGQFEYLFGTAAHKICRESVADMIKSMRAEDIPESLK